MRQSVYLVNVVLTNAAALIGAGGPTGVAYRCGFLRNRRRPSLKSPIPAAVLRPNICRVCSIGSTEETPRVRERLVERVWDWRSPSS